MSKTVEWINWPIFVEEGGGVRQATTAEVLREFNKTINEIADLRAQLAQRDGELEALRAVIEEARARIANRKFGDDGTRIWIEDYMDDLGRLLDRGLKGAGDE